MPLYFRTTIGVLCAILLLSSCVVQHKFASRKYTKGYFADIPSTVPTPKSTSAIHKPLVVSPALPIAAISMQMEEKNIESSSPVTLNKKGQKTSYSETTKRISKPQQEPKTINSHCISTIERSVNRDGGVKQTPNNTSKHTSILSILAFIFCVLPILVCFLLISISALTVDPVVLIFTTFFISYTVLYFLIPEIVGLVLAIIAISKRDSTIGLAYFVLFLDIIVALLILAAIGGI